MLYFHGYVLHTLMFQKLMHPWNSKVTDRFVGYVKYDTIEIHLQIWNNSSKKINVTRYMIWQTDRILVIYLLNDNYSSSTLIIKNTMFHAPTKHIEVHYYYVREILLAVDNLAYVRTYSNITGIFLKIFASR